MFSLVEMICLGKLGKQKHSQNYILVSDFTQQLGQMYEHHAEELQNLVSNFRKRNNDIRKER